MTIALETRPQLELLREHKPGRPPASPARGPLRFDAPPGENCLAEPGQYFPVIDRNRCEGKGDCVRVCPEAVFEVRTIEGQDYDTLSFVGRMRNAIHGRKSAYTPNAGSCQACGLCVEACPEKAISLVTFM